MFTLAIDPGAKPGYSIANTTELIVRPRFIKQSLPRVVAVNTTFAGIAYGDLLVVSAVVTEGQDPSAKRGGKASEANILQLAATRGAQLYRAALTYQCLTRAYVLPVKVWKDALLPGFGCADKAVFCNRIEAELTAAEMQLLAAFPVARRQDLLDSIGINWAGYLLNYPAKLAWKEVS